MAATGQLAAQLQHRGVGGKHEDLGSRRRGPVGGADGRQYVVAVVDAGKRNREVSVIESETARGKPLTVKTRELHPGSSEVKLGPGKITAGATVAAQVSGVDAIKREGLATARAEP